MMKKLGLFLSILVLVALTACNQSNKTNTVEKPLKTVNENGEAKARPGAAAKEQPIELEIKKDSMGVWKVFNNTTHGKPPTVKKNGNRKINWVSKETDLYFQFPGSVLGPERQEDSLKYGYIKHLIKEKTLKLHVKDFVTPKDSGTPDTLYYAIFCMTDSTFVQEDSPPRIIVED